MSDVHVLAIESSCDETAAAVMSNGKLVSNIISSQIDHEKFGGVVPEMASRLHLKKIVSVVHEAMLVAGIRKEKLSAIAFTAGPGLIGSLMVGSSFAKGLALTLNVPLISVHHMHAHIHALFLEERNPLFPFLCLTVSGGHTQIVLVKDYFEFKILGETLDDAAGEAFDKTAKFLGLPYPGGPLIDQLAQKGNADAFNFPEPQIEGYDFSFSGLKTAILYFLQKETKKNKSFIEERINDICASVQHRIVSILINKLKSAAHKHKINEVALAGGVSANSELRKALNELSEKNGWHIYMPRVQYCTDNAAMIAMTGHLKFVRNDFSGQKIAPDASLKF